MPPKSVENFFKSKSRYRMLVENSCDIIFSLNMDGSYNYISPAWEKILGHRLPDVLGHNFREFVFQENIPDCETAIFKAITANSTQEVTYRTHHADGGWRWLTSRVTPHIDENCVLTIIGISQDVTERLRIEELMTQSEKMSMISGMAAGMAHEINNPLGAIMQHAQNIERRVSADIPANHKVAAEVGVSLDLVRAYLQKRGIFDFIGHIRSAGIRSSEIISNMLQFSSRGDRAAEFVDLAALLDRVLELAHTDYDMKKKYNFSRVELLRLYAADLPTVQLTVADMEQVLLNILKNAAQAMADTITCSQPQITLRTRRTDDVVLIDIEDNGSGMDETTRLRVFEPFFSTRDVGVGTGMGLSVAYAIITKGHHGSIEVRSHAGKGSCFTIKLPLHGRS